MAKPPLDHPVTQALQPGHWRCLEELSRAHDYTETRRLYAEGIGKHGVYLRPTGRGFTVLSLDSESCRSMVGVGARNSQQHCVLRLPPARAQIRSAIVGYREKVGSLNRGSREERYALRLISDAFGAGLHLPWPDTYFLHQEWKLPSGRKIDVLAVDLHARSLVVIELKGSLASAQPSVPTCVRHRPGPKLV